MGIKELVLDAAGGVIVEAAKHIAGVVLEKLFGDEKDDGAAERVARATVDAAMQAAALEAANRIAVEQLGPRMRALALQLEADLAKAFAPLATPHGHAGPAEVEVLPPNTEGPMRTLEQELEAVRAEHRALDERLAKERSKS